jgi:hypothetical protein
MRPPSNAAVNFRRCTDGNENGSNLVRQISCDNPFWGAPRIHAELLTLGIEIAHSKLATTYFGDHRVDGRFCRAGVLWLLAGWPLLASVT